MTQKRRQNATKRADELFSKLIRERGYCEGENYRFACSGVLQCAHIISRRYRATRWNSANALSLCGAHHLYWTHHPLEFQDWIDEEFPTTYGHLRELALNGEPERAIDAVARLKGVVPTT